MRAELERARTTETCAGAAARRGVRWVPRVGAAPVCWRWRRRFCRSRSQERHGNATGCERNREPFSFDISASRARERRSSSSLVVAKRAASSGANRSLGETGRLLRVIETEYPVYRVFYASSGTSDASIDEPQYRTAPNSDAPRSVSASDTFESSASAGSCTTSSVCAPTWRPRAELRSKDGVELGESQRISPGL